MDVHPTSPEAHHHSKREHVKEAVDHLLHKFDIPHHHHKSDSARETAPLPLSSAPAEDIPAIPTQTESAVEQPAQAVSPLDTAEASADHVDVHEPTVAEAKSTLPPTIVVTEATNDDHDTQETTAEPRTEQTRPEEAEPAVAVVPSEPVESLKDITEPAEPLKDIAEPAVLVSAAPSPAITEPILVEETEISSQKESLDAVTMQPATSGDADVTPAATAPPSDASSAAETSTPPPPHPKYTHVPPLVPPYAELRRLVAANKQQRPVHRLGWFGYIYGSFVRPVAVIAMECTVAMMCYGLVKVFETARAPASIA
jgi:hypothetical protein